MVFRFAGRKACFTKPPPHPTELTTQHCRQGNCPTKPEIIMRRAFPVKSLSRFLGTIQSDVAQSGFLLNRMERSLYATTLTVISTEGRNLLLLLPDEMQISLFSRNDKYLVHLPNTSAGGHRRAKMPENARLCWTLIISAQHLFGMDRDVKRNFTF